MMLHRSLRLTLVQHMLTLSHKVSATQHFQFQIEKMRYYGKVRDNMWRMSTYYITNNTLSQ